jgi:hypothetical protein
MTDRLTVMPGLCRARPGRHARESGHPADGVVVPAQAVMPAKAGIQRVGCRARPGRHARESGHPADGIVMPTWVVMPGKPGIQRVGLSCPPRPSCPRKRASSGWGGGVRRVRPWIPASAGMTGWKAEDGLEGRRRAGRPKTGWKAEDGLEGRSGQRIPRLDSLLQRFAQLLRGGRVRSGDRERGVSFGTCHPMLRVDVAR